MRAVLVGMAIFAVAKKLRSGALALTCRVVLVGVAGLVVESRLHTAACAMLRNAVAVLNRDMHGHSNGVDADKQRGNEYVEMAHHERKGRTSVDAVSMVTRTRDKEVIPRRCTTCRQLNCVIRAMTSVANRCRYFATRSRGSVSGFVISGVRSIA